MKSPQIHITLSPLTRAQLAAFDARLNVVRDRDVDQVWSVGVELWAFVFLVFSAHKIMVNACLPS